MTISMKFELRTKKEGDYFTNHIMESGEISLDNSIGSQFILNKNQDELTIPDYKNYKIIKHDLNSITKKVKVGDVIYFNTAGIIFMNKHGFHGHATSQWLVMGLINYKQPSLWTTGNTTPSILMINIRGDIYPFFKNFFQKKYIEKINKS